METNPTDMIINNRIDSSLMVDESMMVGRKINELIGLGYTVEIAGSRGMDDDKFIHLTLARPGDIGGMNTANIRIRTYGDNTDRKILFTLQKMQEAIESGV